MTGLYSYNFSFIIYHFHHLLFHMCVWLLRKSKTVVPGDGSISDPGSFSLQVLKKISYWLIIITLSDIV